MFITALNRNHKWGQSKKEYTSLLISHRKTERKLDQLKQQLQDLVYIIYQAVLEANYNEQQRLKLKADIEETNNKLASLQPKEKSQMPEKNLK